MVAFRKRSYRKKSSMKKRVYKKKSASKATFSKRVKTVISRMAENKHQNFRGGQVLYPYGSTNWGNSIISCTPDSLFLSIDQGTGQGERVGNSIRVKSLKLSGVIRILPHDAILNPNPVPHYIKFFFLTRKDTPTDIFGTLDGLLQYGNSSENPGNSTSLQNLYRPVNTDLWTIHTTKVFKIGYSNFGGTSADLGAQTFSNNDFKMNHFVNMDLTKYCTKHIKFNDNITTPTTRNVVLYPVLYTSDGSNVANQQLSRFEYALDIVYEDL